MTGNILLAICWIAGAYEPPAETNHVAFFADAPATVLRRTFRLASIPAKAELELAVAGLCDVTVNGRRLTETTLSAWTPYDHRVLVDRHDIRAALKTGENEVRLDLGNGWYNPLPMRMWGALNLREHLATGTPCVRGTLRLTDASGAVSEYPTDESWQAADGQVVRNNLYLGERRDLTRPLSPWRPARPVTGPKGRLVDRGDFPALVIHRRHDAVSVKPTVNGRYLVDFGENLAGTIRLTVRGTRAGQEIRCRYGESLWSDGTINVMTAVCGQIKDPAAEPCGIAEARDEWRCPAADELTLEPRFAFHAFRYVEIAGLADAPRTNDVQVLAWSADVKPRGSFVCSNERLNRLHEMCLRTFRNNLQSVQSDCPGREKFGYGGDMAATAESFALNYGMKGFYRKVVRDFLDEAAADGWFTETAPYVGIRGIPPAGATGHAGPIGWAVGVPIALDVLVRYDGDLEIVREAYPALRRYLANLERTCPDGLVSGCLGDWEAIQKPDASLTATAHYRQFALLTARFARLLGDEAESRRLETLAAKIAAAAGRKFARCLGPRSSDRLNDMTFAVYHGLYAPAEEAGALKRMKEDLFAQGYALTGGIFSTQYLLEILGSRGENALAGRLVLNDRSAGWMRMLDLGATTIWEVWYGTSGSASLDHPMFGSVEQWFYRHLLGIRVAPDAVGGDKFTVEPQPIAGVTWARGWIDTPHGRIASAWHLDAAGRLVIDR